MLREALLEVVYSASLQYQFTVPVYSTSFSSVPVLGLN